MAQGQKVKFYAQERLIIPDVNNLQDFIEEDFQLYNTKLLTETSQIVSGFAITNLGGLDIAITVDGSTLINSAGTYKSFYVGDSGATALSETLADNTTNYVHVIISKESGSEATRAFWDPTLNNNEGGEFIEDVDTAEYLIVESYVNQTGFSSDANKLAVVEIVTAGGVITSITDRRNMFFRLGRGSNPTYTKTLTTPSEVLSNFLSADREISDFKFWLDFVMTKFKKMQGTAYWWQDPPISLSTIGFKLTGGGSWSWDISTPDLSSYLVINGAKIVSPNIPFSTNGTAGGTFQVNSITGLSVNQRVQLTDGLGTFKYFVIKNITSLGGPPWQIDMDQADLGFTADAEFVILGTAFINYIRTATESPICLSPNDVAYVDLDTTANVDLTVSVVQSSLYTNAETRYIVARRVSDSVYVG